MRCPLRAAALLLLLPALACASAPIGFSILRSRLEQSRLLQLNQLPYPMHVGGPARCPRPSECAPQIECSNGTGMTGTCPSVLDTCCYERRNRAPPECGVRHPDGQRPAPAAADRRRPNDDTRSQFGELPWTAAVMYKQRLANGSVEHQYHGGGALIHPAVVLTVAHIVDGYACDKLAVRVGEWNLAHADAAQPHQTADVASYVIHERFHSRALYNDVALLFLGAPVRLAAHVGTVCLPPPNYDGGRIECLVSGWGKDRGGLEGRVYAIRRRVEMPVVPHAECQQRLRRTRLGRRFQLDGSFMCAGGEPDRDVCEGAGGSPLVARMPGTSDRYQLVGMVAWGIGCNDAVPGVYVRVARFRDWIDMNMAGRYYY